MAVSLISSEKGYLDDISLKKIVDFERDLLQHVRLHHMALLQRINQEQTLSPEIELALISVVEEFKAAWII